MNENHQNGRDKCIHKKVHQQHGCTTQLQHSAKSSGCKFVLGGRGRHCQQLWGRGCASPLVFVYGWPYDESWRSLGSRTQTTTVTKISTDIDANFWETNNLPCQWYLSPPYVLLNQGGKVHSIDRVGEVLLVHLFGNACKKWKYIEMGFT